MKKFFTLAFSCLWFMAVCAQIPTGQIQKRTSANDGIYLFETAELFIRNKATQEIIEHKIITDTASIHSHDLHLGNTFLMMKLSNGRLHEIILADRKKYIIDDMMTLKLAKEDKNKEDKHKIRPQAEDEKMHTHDGKRLPPYSMKNEGENLVITFAPYSFGHSAYNFTLEAKLVVTLTKQKDDEKDAK